MPASALATSAEWQSAVAHHPVGMRRDRSPPATSSGLRPRTALLYVFFSTLLLLAHLSPTPTAAYNQLYVVCKNLDTQTCVTWLLEMQNDRELSNELTPRPLEVCGMSDLKPIPPHRKFIAVKLFNEDATVFCKNVNVVTKDAFHLNEVVGPFTSLYRQRRQTGYNIRGRYRGQTQSQYLAIDGGNGKDEGKAEAHSAADSSRASVSGNSGMGQAQSQTIYDPSCDECLGGRNDMEVSNLRRPEQDNYGYGQGTQGGLSGNRPSSGSMGGQGVPSQEGMGGPGIQGHGGMGGSGVPSQGGMTPGRQGQGGMGGNGVPSQGGMGGQRGPSQGGMGGQRRPSQGGMGGQGIPSQGGMGGQEIPSQGGMGGQGITSPGGMGGQGMPSQGGMGGQGIPSQGGMGGPGVQGQGGMGGNGVPSQGGMGGPGMQGQGGMGGNGVPSQGGMSGPGMRGQGGMGGNRGPSQGGMTGSGMQGQGGMGGNGVPSQGGMTGPGMQGQGGMGGNGVPSQGGMTGPGMQGQGGMGGNGVPSQGGMRGPGMQGPGGLGGNGIPSQGGMSGQGMPSPSGMGGPGLPSQGGMGGPGIPSQGGVGGLGIPSQGGMGGPGIPSQGGMGGPGIPSHGGVGGLGIPSQGGMGGLGIPSQGGMGGPGIPSQGGMGGPGIPSQGGMGGPGIPSQGGMGGPGIPSQGGMSGQRIPSPGGMGGPGLPSQGGLGGPGIPSQGGMGGPGMQVQGGMGGPGIPSQSGMGGLGIQGQGGLTPRWQGQGGIGVNRVPSQEGMGGQGVPSQGGIGGQGIPSQGGMGGPGMQGQGGMGGNGVPSQGGITPGIQGQGYPSYDTSVVPSGSEGRFNWPLASGTVRGADGLIYYCCVVNPNQGYYANQASGLGTGVQGAPQGTYIQTGVGPQGPGGVGQQSPYDHVDRGNGHGISYGPSTGPQGTYRNEPPSMPHGTGVDGQPDSNRLYGPTGGRNGGNGQATHPYIHDQTGQNRPNGQDNGPVVGNRQANTYDQDGNGVHGPNYSQMNPDGTYIQHGNGQQVPNYNYDSQTPYKSGGNNQQGPNYTYNPSGVSQQDTGNRHTQSESGPQNSYDSGGNGRPTPDYNYGGKGLSNIGGTNIQGGVPQTFVSSNYPTTSGGQPSSHGVYQQGPQSTGGPGNIPEGNGLNGPGYSYNTGGGGQPGPSGTYIQNSGGAQTPYDNGGNGQQGPGSTYEQPGLPQPPNSIGLQNSYQNGANSQGQDYNQKYGGQGQQNMGGTRQSQVPGIRTDQNGEPQNVMDPNSIVGENDDSQALASVYQGKNGTTAAASSQGGNEKGHAQTSVQGTYTDSGSFSAQASISDETKGAESQVSGSNKGATSNAEGRGRKNKSQAAVKLGSETGSIQTESQSGGNMHSSNTQVQGSVKGGVADAQARGPGSTSSQAQIGFTPYKEGDKAHELLNKPFEGGGTAAAQSSGRMGTSQSQLRGTFKYGITYNGAAQAGASLDKDAVFPNFTPFEKIDVFDQNNTNIDINLESTEKPRNVDLPANAPKINVNTIQDTMYDGHSHYDHHKTNEEINTTSILPLPSNRRAFSPSYGSNNNNNNNGGDYDYNVDDTPTDDYDVEEVSEGVAEDNIQNEYTGYDNYGREMENTHQSQRQLSSSRKGLEVKQTTGGNTQHILIGSLKNQDAKITQLKSERPDESKVYQPGESVPGMGGYTIPVGFTGSVKSVSSKEKTLVVGTRHSPSQAQTVTLTPGTGKVSYVHPERYGKNNINPKDLRSLYNPRADDNRYVSVSKSVTRDLDNENNIRKQYSHTYYTKSSSCGYFTFTCTMVSSAEGKKKVCKPKLPTNPDGTPMRC